MRTKKSLYNATSSMLIYVIRAILLFVVRIVFIKTLGKVYLGVDSLFTNILTVLSIADLGINTAINYSLYKPLSDKDYKKVSIIMSFYKKVYKYLGLIVFAFGLVIMLFLNVIVKENVENIYLIYIIYLLSTVITYFISYKDALLIADQKYYKVSFILGFSYICMYILRIIFLLTIPSFIIFSLIQLFVIIIQRFLINRYISHKYDYIDFNVRESLPKNEQKKIFTNIKSIFLNKVGLFLVTGTDNIIISSLSNLGVSVVAVYTNYYSITGMVDTIISKAISSITSSYGDLAVNEEENIQENVFDIVAFITYILYGLFSIGFLFLLSDLIKICFGRGFVLDFKIVLIICLNFYFNGILKSLDMIKEATGNYVVDRFINVIQAIVNIVLSIVLGHFFGLFGVVLATFISTIMLPLWNRPYVAYKLIFHKKPFKYYYKQLLYFMLLILISVFCYFTVSKIVLNNILIDFIIKMILICIIFTLMIIIFFHKSKEFEFDINKFKRKKK